MMPLSLPLVEGPVEGPALSLSKGQSSQPLIAKYLDILQPHSKNAKIMLLFSPPTLPVC